MAEFYILNTQTKSQARNILKLLKGKFDKYSSSYYLNDSLFIILSATHRLNTEIAHKFAIRLELCIYRENPCTALEVLTNWGISELMQDINFINYEMKAASSPFACCHMNFESKQILRSYQPLTELMLIINNTPDSFSENGKVFNQLKTISAKVENALCRGVSIIDVGAESTRPDARIITAKEEINRLEALLTEISRLKQCYNFKLSLDSYKPETIIKFLNIIDIVNDVSGKMPSSLLETIAKKQKIYLPMHSLTLPADRSINIPVDENPIDFMLKWGQDKLDQLLNIGFTKEQIILDIGIGFNKTPEQSWYLLRNIGKLHNLGVELLVGHSRKSFMNKITRHSFGERDLETAVISNYLCHELVDYLRVHDLDFFERISGINSQLQN